MKCLSMFAVLLPTTFLVIACTTPLPAQSPTAIQTEITVPTPPIDLSAAGTPQVLQGPEIHFQGIHFHLDPAIGSRLYAMDDAITLDGSTAHSTRFALRPEQGCITWCVEIYPISNFEKSFGSFVFPPAGYRGGAAVIFTAQERMLSFQTGSGNRALEAFGQNHYPVSNESLKYVFRGYSPDKQYGFFVQVPVRAPGLPDVSPTVTSGSDPTTEIETYNDLAAQSMDQLSQADFTPSLDVLDALAESMRIQGK